MITETEIQRLEKLRQNVFKQIEKDISGAKSSEGRFSILVPDYWEEKENSKSKWGLSLVLYVFGPGRDYMWTGITLMQAIIKAEKDINKWIEEKN